MSIRRLTKKQAIELATEDYYKNKNHNYVFNVPAKPEMGYCWARRGEIGGRGINEVWNTSNLWRPLLMKPPLVMASFAGDKTETRRLAKHQPEKSHKSGYYICDGFHLDKDHFLSAIADDAPYKPGDLLYVRERWQAVYHGDHEEGSFYWNRVTKEERENKNWVYLFPDYQPSTDHEIFHPKVWLPSIHMPKEASRLWLEVTNCYPQFLQDITGDQCLAEGIGIHDGNCSEFEKFDTQDELYHRVFAHMWDEIAGKNGAMWADNPLVWVTEYKRVDYGPFVNGGK